MLIITDAARQRAAEIVALISQYRNWTVPKYSGPSEEVSNLSWHFFEPSIRADFFWIYLVEDKRVYRQITIRHAQKGKMPTPDIAYTIASWFGFTGGIPSDDMIMIRKPGPDWVLHHWKDYDSTIIQQEIYHAEYSRFL